MCNATLCHYHDNNLYVTRLLISSFMYHEGASSLQVTLIFGLHDGVICEFFIRISEHNFKLDIGIAVKRKLTSIVFSVVRLRSRHPSTVLPVSQFSHVHFLPF